MKKLRTLGFMVLIAMSLLTPAPIASQNPESQTATAASKSADEELLRTAAALVRQSQYGSESFAAAMQEITTLLTKHSDSVVAPLLAAILDGMHEKDATHNFNVAMFYLYKHGSQEAAESRLRRIVEKYPKYSRFDEVLYQLSLIESESDRRAEATQTLERLISGYELSPRIHEAQAKLKILKGGQ